MYYNKEKPSYYLPTGTNRLYSITIYEETIVFEGEFWYLRNKEFYTNKGKTDATYIKNFIGMGYLEKRSYKKCVAFVLSGLVLTAINTITVKLSKWADEANFFLQWIGKTVALPEWMAMGLKLAMIICLLLGILFFFSKKKVVEISFTDKRICLPQKSLSDVEFAKLYQTIRRLADKKAIK